MGPRARPPLQNPVFLTVKTDFLPVETQPDPSVSLEKAQDCQERPQKNIFL